MFAIGILCPAQIASAFPDVDNFVNRWPIETVMIGICKSAKAAEKKAVEKAVIDATHKLRSVRYLPFSGFN